MASESHAQYDGIDVEIIDRESHRDYDAVQIQAVSDSVTLSDQSGGEPWVPAGEVDE